MLGSSEWAGGLRDRALVVTEERRAAVEPTLRATIDRLARTVFHIMVWAHRPARAADQPDSASQVSRQSKIDHSIDHQRTAIRTEKKDTT